MPAATATRARGLWLMPIVAAAALALGLAVDRWILTNQQSDWRNPLDGATFTRLTDFEGLEADAVISLDGNFVAFLSDRSGALDVWVLQLGSGQFLNLTNGKLASVYNSQIRVLGFTADSSHVTVMTRRTNITDIGTSIIPTIGGISRLVMEGRVDPQWSPDGKRLLFFSVVQNKDVMYVAAADGSNAMELFPVAPGEHNHFVAWSPSGRSVYSVRSTRSIEETDIWRAPATGGQPERVTNHNTWTAYPTPLDERTLLYIATDESHAGTWLYAMDLEQRQQHRLSVGIEQYSSIAASPPVAGRPRRLVATVSNPVSPACGRYRSANPSRPKLRQRSLRCRPPACPHRGSVPITCSIFRRDNWWMTSGSSRTVLQPDSGTRGRCLPLRPFPAANVR